MKPLTFLSNDSNAGTGSVSPMGMNQGVTPCMIMNCETECPGHAGGTTCPNNTGGISTLNGKLKCVI